MADGRIIIARVIWEASDADPEEAWDDAYVATDAILAALLEAGLVVDTSRIANLEAQIVALSTPDLWCDGEGTGIESPEDALGYSGPGVVMVGASRSLGSRYVATRCLTVDEYGDGDDTEPVVFATHEEALRCWSESIAAIRDLAKEPTDG